MMKLNQLLKPNVVDTETFSQLPPKHREVVNDFFSQVDYDNVDVVKEVEATVDKVIDLEEGDLLWLPPKLYHRVETLGPRISISFHFHPPEKQGGWREPWLDWIGDING